MKAVNPRDRATFAGPWYYLYVLGLIIVKRGRSFTTWTMD